MLCEDSSVILLQKSKHAEFRATKSAPFLTSYFNSKNRETYMSEKKQIRTARRANKHNQMARSHLPGLKSQKRQSPPQKKNPKRKRLPQSLESDKLANFIKDYPNRQEKQKRKKKHNLKCKSELKKKSQAHFPQSNLTQTVVKRKPSDRHCTILIPLGRKIKIPFFPFQNQDR